MATISGPTAAAGLACDNYYHLRRCVCPGPYSSSGKHFIGPYFFPGFDIGLVIYSDTVISGTRPVPRLGEYFLRIDGGRNIRFISIG